MADPFGLNGMIAHTVFPSPSPILQRAHLLQEQYRLGSELIGRAVSTLEQLNRINLDFNWSMANGQMPTEIFNYRNMDQLTPLPHEQLPAFDQQRQLQFVQPQSMLPRYMLPNNSQSAGMYPQQPFFDQPQQMQQQNMQLPSQLLQLPDIGERPTPVPNQTTPQKEMLELQPVKKGSMAAEECLWNAGLTIDGNGSDNNSNFAVPPSPPGSQDGSAHNVQSEIAILTPWMPQNGCLADALAPLDQLQPSHLSHSMQQMLKELEPMELEKEEQLGMSGHTMDMDENEEREDQTSLATSKAYLMQLSLLRSTPSFFIFPGKNGMIRVDLRRSMLGYSTSTKNSLSSVRQFIRHIMSKVYENPEASIFVTAACERSRKKYKIVPESSLRLLAVFWQTHFKCTKQHSIGEVLDAVATQVKIFLTANRSKAKAAI